MRRRNELALLPKSPLLITESADEFDALRDAFEQEIKPRGIIEQMYVHDICAIVWEILRLRRCKVVIINSAFRSALQDLLMQLLKQPGQYSYDVEDEAQALAHAWFTDKEARKQVLETLSRIRTRRVSHRSGSHQEVVRRPRVARQDAELVGGPSRQGAWLRCRISRQPSAPAAPERGPASSTARVFFGSTMHRARGQRRPDHGERTANCRQPPQRAQEHRSSIRRR